MSRMGGGGRRLLYRASEMDRISEGRRGYRRIVGSNSTEGDSEMTVRPETKYQWGMNQTSI